MEGKKKAENKVQPTHYHKQNRKECYKEIIDVFGVEYFKHFCLLNVYKYHYRHKHKNGAEDLAKAKWYAEKYIELGGSLIMLDKCKGV